MDTKKLRQKILDLAIRGKLVPQDPDDEPAIELLKRINPRFEPCENGFVSTQFPDNWCWVRGIDIFEPMRSTQPQGDTFKYIDIDAIDNKRNVITSVKVLNSREAPSRASRYTEKGNVLFSMVRPYLRNISMVPEDGCIASTGFYVCGEKECLDSHFCLYLMLSDYVVSGLNEFMKGDNSPSINKSHIDSFAFPLPPLSEQKRIVTAIEQWFALIDVLENEKDGLQAAIQQAKSKILDLAIHGKLVPQDPNDEPASNLLKRINPKFEECKKEQHPYEIPKNWIWAKGMDIFEPMKSVSPAGESFNYIDIDAIDNKRNIVISAKKIKTKEAPSRASRYTEKGNVLFSMVRPYLRNIAMVSENECIASTGFFVCREKPYLNNSFCLYLMLSDYVVDGLNEHMKGDNSPSISKNQIESFLFPLPPYQEQLRIVTKIEELFAVLDSIKESLE